MSSSSPRREVLTTKPGENGPKNNGFTLVELLVVIGSIALLISMLLPALGVARQQAMKVKCLSQMKQLGNAFVMYVNDNKGWMPSCDTCGPLYPANFTDSSENAIFQTVSPNNTWVGWVDGGPTTAALSNGTLWKYIGNAAVYKCPSDLNDYRTRTYSMNSFICTGDNTWLTTCQFKIYRITQVRDATKTIVFTEESDPRSFGANATPNTMMTQWNLGGWYENPLICDTLSNQPEATNGYWDDTIASWHRGGSNIAFADGHAEYWRWTDTRTVNMLKNDPTWPSPRYYTPGDVDLIHLRSGICTWGMQRGQ
jgi:prepilin-type processing-associated H-X9-DG protein